MTTRLLAASWLICAFVLGGCGGGGSGGPGTTNSTVPNVVGDTQATATTSLNSAGLMLGTVTAQTSATVSSGDVISESPAAGTSVAPGSSVSLVVSTGAAPPVSVPNVVGDTQAAAMSAITGAGLAVGTVSQQSSGTVTTGDVISETPAAGTSVNAGSAVQLVISAGMPTANSIPVIVDGGPTVLTQANMYDGNTLFATVTICSPGTNACTTIDHMQVDTGSTGVRILHDALSGTAVPQPVIDPTTMLPLMECYLYADGWTWGSMDVVDITIGTRTISNFVLDVIGDPAAGTAASDCSTKTGPSENSVSTFGANGIIGIGNFAQDCGPACVANAFTQAYYTCLTPLAANPQCTPTAVALNNQAWNPVSLLVTDNNGVAIQLPAVAPPGTASVAGTLYFGVDTQANNALGAATLYTLVPSTSATGNPGTLNTIYKGQTYSSSFIDSGSNAYFFPDNSIALCASNSIAGSGFFCPSSPPLNLSGVIQGVNLAQATVPFTIDSAVNLFSDPNLITAFPTLGGPNTSANGQGGFDWGLPFFYGRTVFVLIEGKSAGGTPGPAVGF